MHLIEEKIYPARSAEILAVGGGKGGVGKTCFAVNLAVEIASRGWKTIVLDADLSCSNVEAVLGVQCSTRLDEFFFQKGRKNLDAIIHDTGYENLRIIPGTSGLLDVANPRYQLKVALIRELRKLDADLVILDLDAGAHFNTLDFFLLAADSGVLVITPERTSIDNAFKFLRAALFRRITRFYNSPEVGLLLKRCQSLSEFIESVRNSNYLEDEIGEQVVVEMTALARSMRPRIVVNKASNVYEAKIAANILCKYVKQYLKIEPELLGHLYFDQYVTKAVNSSTPFVVGDPKRKISTCIVDMANRLGYF
ncbi:MAG: P-loop NTPase [Candidatus Hydrogenedentes bacterium]|nr:P-loop NTPase [Candidatus Hydrogenedentota bacterium]